MVLSPLWFEIISELLVNLSAGWFAVVLAFPLAFRPLPPNYLVLLTANLAAGIMALVVAKKLRELKEVL